MNLFVVGWSAERPVEVDVARRHTEVALGTSVEQCMTDHAPVPFGDDVQRKERVLPQVGPLGLDFVLADVVDPVPSAEKLGAPDRTLAVTTDVSDATSVRAMVDAAVARFGRIDVLVNNAAVFATLRPRPLEEIAEEEWDRVMAVNVKGIWNCVRAVAPDGPTPRIR